MWVPNHPAPSKHSTLFFLALYNMIEVHYHIHLQALTKLNLLSVFLRIHWIPSIIRTFECCWCLKPLNISGRFRLLVWFLNCSCLANWAHPYLFCFSSVLHPSLPLPPSPPFSSSSPFSFLMASALNSSSSFVLSMHSLYFLPRQRSNV